MTTPDSPRSRHGDTPPAKAVLTEGALIDGLVAGDAGAFEELVRTRGPRMMAVALRYVTRREDAEDALQEAFVAVVRSIRSFSRASALETWLHRIVVNCSLMTLRRRRRKPETSLDEGTMDEGAASPWRRWGAPPAHEILAKAELRTAIRDEIAKLPESQRAVLLLRDVEGLELKEIAELLELGLSTIKIRLHRARHALQAQLGPIVAEALS